MILKEDMTVVAQRKLAPDIFEMVLTGEMVSDMQAGQFLHLRVPDSSKLCGGRFLYLRLIGEKKKLLLFTGLKAGDGCLFAAEDR